MSPRYDFFCQVCHDEREVTKSFKDAESDEICSRCSALMQMIIHPVNSNRSNCQFESHFNYAFGKKIASKTELKNAIAMHEGETGKKLIEVGTEGMHHVKKPKKTIKLNDDEMRQAHQILAEVKDGNN